MSRHASGSCLSAAGSSTLPALATSHNDAMTQIAALSETYTQARQAFLDAAGSAGARFEHHVHSLTGPTGEELAIDVAEFGAADATNVVVVLSATHGVEGYCGSALQRHWLEHHLSELPDSVGLIMVHALNPYGFAWVRRVNEDNVDLNRNFIDWSKSPPANTDYDRIAELVVPSDWSEATQAASLTALLELANEIGLDRMQGVVSGGQYSNPTGVFYGGTKPVWSHQWLRAWAASRLANVEQLTIIDLHTGLGASGHGELIGSEPTGSEMHRRAEQIWGDVRSMLDGDSVSAALSGDWLAIVNELAPHAACAAVALEFGTVDPITVLQALRADAVLHAHGNPTGPDAGAVRAQVRAAFADDRPEWIADVWSRFSDVLTKALAHAGGVRSRQ